MSETTTIRPDTLTQAAAAQLAGVSVATWRRWENNPTEVSEATRRKCENALRKATKRTKANQALDRALAEQAAQFERHWHDSLFMTPRQAHDLAGQMHLWADSSFFILDNDSFHGGLPFDEFDLRVMMSIGENRAWLEQAGRRCHDLGDLLMHGINPLDHAHCLFDEVMLLAAVVELMETADDREEHVRPQPPARLTPDADDPDQEYSDPYDRPIEDDQWSRLGQQILSRSATPEIVEAVLGFSGFDDDWEDERQYGQSALDGIGEPGSPAPHPFRWFDQRVPKP